MSSAFERGKEDGNAIDPTCASLEEREQAYQEEMSGLGDLGDYAAQHREYIQGWIAGVREAYQE